MRISKLFQSTGWLSRLTLPLLCFAALAACSGGGGGGNASTGTPATNGSGNGSAAGSTPSSTFTGQPMIVAGVYSYSKHATPAGISTNSSVGVSVENQSGTSPITTATVTVNGVSLAYSSKQGGYLGTLNISPGSAIKLSVRIGIATYNASATLLGNYPAIITPVSNATWSSQVANVITWSHATDSNGQYALGIVDASGNFVWPTQNRLLVVPANRNTLQTVDANVLSAGNYQVMVSIYGSTDIPGAAPGSQLEFFNVDQVPIRVNPSSPPPLGVTLSSLVLSPTKWTLASGDTKQLAVTGDFSDGSKQDLTTQATWSTSDSTKVTVSGDGLVSAVAAGNAAVTAKFNGLTASTQVYVTNPSPTPALTQSVTYQINPAHSGVATVGGSGPTFPPSAHWSTTLDGPVSYPIVAGGEVIVTTGAIPNPISGATNYGTSLYALDETNGAVIWGPVLIPGNYWWSAAAYDHGKVFVVNENGVLRSFDAATGVAGWSRQLFGPAVVDAPPTAVNGIVYVGGASVGGTLYAVDESSGALLWKALLDAEDQSSPTVSQDGVFISYSCDAYKFDPLVGTQLWYYNSPCTGVGGETSVFAGGSLFVPFRGANVPPNAIVAAETGEQVGTFSSTATPVISGQSAYYLQSGTLSAVDLTTQSTRWTFAGDGGLQEAPIVIDSVVVIASATGMVYALNADTGAVLWSGHAAAASVPGGEVKAGLGEGDGYLVVPSGSVVSAWKIVP